MDESNIFNRLDDDTISEVPPFAETPDPTDKFDQSLFNNQPGLNMTQSSLAASELSRYIDVSQTDAYHTVKSLM